MDEELILGRYRLLAELGEGGHGAVDLAFDTKMARRVAIKRIPVSRRGIQILSHTTGLAEARTAALLNHPNIVTVYEWDTDDDEAFLIMEHVDGASLAELLDHYSPLSADEAAAVISQVADAVAYAHENGVLHLDLKPENVLVTRAGLVKVADFGVAALTNAAGQAISAGGTLGYMPPEQLRGEEVDTRTDVWAFAALAMQTLTGAVPFAADTADGALFKIERFAAPEASTYVRNLSAEVDDVLAEALAAEPDDRPDTVRAVARDLLACLGDPVTGRESLAAIASELSAEDEEIEEEAFARLGLWDRLASGAATGERAACAVAAGWLGWSGMAAFGFAWPIAAVACAMVAVAGAVAPSLGLGVGCVLLSAGAFATSVPLGLAVGVVAGAWWITVGRIRPAAGAIPVFAPLAGVLRMSPALPLLSGFFIEGVWATTTAGAMSGVVLVASSIAGRATVLPEVQWPALVAPLGAPGSAGPLSAGLLIRAAAVVLSWAAAAALSSVGARRGTRLGAAAGMAAGLLIMAGSLGPWVTGGSRMDPATVLQLLLASILVVVVVALGPPVSSGDAGDREARVQNQ
ncbi:MAG TPA: serine/threonine-protein kinase [Coriobacteriia bacterium]